MYDISIFCKLHYWYIFCIIFNMYYILYYRFVLYFRSYKHILYIVYIIYYYAISLYICLCIYNTHIICKNWNITVLKKMSCWLINVYLTLKQKALKVSIYINIYHISGHKSSTTHRVLKPHRSKMGIIYMKSWKQCALPVITTTALWQPMHLWHMCVVDHLWPPILCSLLSLLNTLYN